MKIYLHNFVSKNMKIAFNYDVFFGFPIVTSLKFSGLFSLCEKFQKIIILKQKVQSFE